MTLHNAHTMIRQEVSRRLIGLCHCGPLRRTSPLTSWLDGFFTERSSPPALLLPWQGFGEGDAEFPRHFFPFPSPPFLFSLLRNERSELADSLRDRVRKYIDAPGNGGDHFLPKSLFVIASPRAVGSLPLPLARAHLEEVFHGGVNSGNLARFQPYFGRKRVDDNFAFLVRFSRREIDLKLSSGMPVCLLRFCVEPSECRDILAGSRLVRFERRIHGEVVHPLHHRLWHRNVESHSSRPLGFLDVEVVCHSNTPMPTRPIAGNCDFQAQRRGWPRPS